MASIDSNSEGEEEEETKQLSHSQQHPPPDDDDKSKTLKSSNNDLSPSSTSALTHQQSIPFNPDSNVPIKSLNTHQITTADPSTSSLTHLQPVPHISDSTNNDQFTMPDPSSLQITESSNNDDITAFEPPSSAHTDQEPVPQNSQSNVPTNLSNNDQIKMGDSSPSSSSSTSALADRESVPENSQSNVATKSLKSDQITTGESSSSISAFNDQESAPLKEDTGLTSELAETEKKALMELRSKITEAILMNTLFEVHKHPNAVPGEESSRNAKEKQQEQEKASDGEYGDKGKSKQSDQGKAHENKGVEIDENISIWGVPLLPSKGDKGTDVILLKFLRAREFKVNETYEMLRRSLQWRKEFKMDTILEEEFGTKYDSVAYTNGEDRQGHPVCYNIYGTFGDDDMYNKTFGTEEGHQKFLRWRLRLMEMQIKKLDFKPGGVSSLLQINDLNNAPAPSKKDIRNVTKEAVQLLQDNYPEFVARNIFVNVPIWYYAFNALLSPFLTQRTKSKFIFSRPAGVTETLLEYIAAEEIPFQYGGFKRDKDPHFSTSDGVSEVAVKVASTQSIEIPAPEVGSILVWELIVLGWEVKYKEEFVPTDEESYTLIVKKERKMGWQQGSLRNTFKNKEPGKLVITITNASFKRKRVLYRHKAKTD